MRGRSVRSVAQECDMTVGECAEGEGVEECPDGWFGKLLWPDQSDAIPSNHAFVYNMAGKRGKKVNGTGR